MIRTQLQMHILLIIMLGVGLVLGWCFALIWSDVRERRRWRRERYGAERYRGKRRG